MKTTLIEKKYALEYIKDILNSYIKTSKKIEYKYHHNSSYNDLPLIINYGILPIKELIERNIKNYSIEYLNSLDDDESHVNGNNGISLSITGLTDIYNGEEIYDPINNSMVDILVDGSIKAFRFSNNYGNEFITRETIPITKIKSFDIRLLDLINNKNLDDNIIKDIINNFNYIIEASNLLLKLNIDIPIRECSYNEKELSKEISTEQKLVLKK